MRASGVAIQQVLFGCIGKAQVLKPALQSASDRTFLIARPLKNADDSEKASVRIEKKAGKDML